MNDEEIKKENNEPLEKSLNDALNDDNFQDLEFVESTEDGEALPTKDVTKKIREDLKICRKEKEEYLTGWQRAKADYINLQKEIESTHLNSSIYTKERMMNNLIPALDSFEMAFSNKEAWNNVDENWRKGIEYIYQQLMTGITNSGIEKIDTVDVPFNPQFHESLEIIETNEKDKDHTIEKIIQPGYKIGSRVIRPAKVNIYEYKN